MSLLETIHFFDFQISINPAPKQDLYFKYIPLLSPVIVIVTFLFNNLYTRSTKKAESKRAWYFKAYFEPHIKKTEAFFSYADTLMDQALKFCAQNEETWTTEEFTEYVGKVLFDLANAKRKFEIEVVSNFQSTYPEVFDKLMNSLLNFEDAGTTAFQNDSEDPYFNYVTEINSIKNELIKALSGPALA